MAKQCVRCGNLLMGFEQLGEVCNPCLDKRTPLMTRPMTEEDRARQITTLSRATPEVEAKTIAWKGQSFAERLVRLYSADMVKAFYAHYHGLFEAETAAGDPTLASYYLSVSNTLYANIPKGQGDDDS